MSIAGGDFSQRLTDIEPGTEVGRLKLALNTMLNRVDASLSQRDAAVQRMRRFIGDASHELRTPLVTVRGYAELYRIGAIQGDDDIAQAMERIEKEAMRMGVLVEDLLALARLDEQRELVFAPIDLRPIARDAALDARAAEPARTITAKRSRSSAESPSFGTVSRGPPCACTSNLWFHCFGMATSSQAPLSPSEAPASQPVARARSAVHCDGSHCQTV